MIKEIIKLPLRDIYGEISSISPVFNFNEGLENVNWVGKEIESSTIKDNFYKYKLVTRVNHNIVERIIYCPEDIDFNKKWWTSHAPVHTISSKIINTKNTSAYAPVTRYLTGTMDVLDQCDSFNPTQMTIYNKVKNILGISNPLMQNQFASCILKNQKNANLLNTAVCGNDDANIDIMQNAYYLSNVIDDYGLTSFDLVESKLDFLDDYSTFFSSNFSVKDLALFKALDTLYSAHKTSIIHFEPPFEVNNKVLLTEDNDNRIYTLHTLLQYIEASSFTDMHALLSIDRTNAVKFNCDLYSDYFGKNFNHKDTAKYLNDLKLYMLKWLAMEGERPIALNLTKNSCEEVFMTVLYGNNKVKNYYFDLSIYSLLNHSFVDCVS